MPNQATHSYTARRGAFAQAIEACEELIRDYEKHRDHDGNVTGPDFNAMEIEAVKAAIVRIQCIETREVPPSGPSRPEWRKIDDGCGTPHAIHVTRTELEKEQPLTFWTMYLGEFYECRVYLYPVETPPPATTRPIEKDKP